MFLVQQLKRLLGFTVYPPAAPLSPANPSVPAPASAPAPLAPVDASVTGPVVAIVNHSTVVSDAQVAAAVAALQIQVSRDFAPVWKITAHLMAVPNGGFVPPYAWVIYILDTSDQAGALGYHDLTPAGNPVGKVFAKDDQKYGLSWTVTLSHELLEMLVDPWIENVSFNQQTNTSGTLYAFEVADAVEDDRFGYAINGILVSDFVFPSWFEGWRQPNSTKFDFRGVLHAPLTLAPGGYIGAFAIPNSNGWETRTAEAAPSARLLSKGAESRVKRRGKPLA